MKIKLSWQRRAILVLATSLVLLSMILAVFAIREAEREKLVQEKETAEEQLRVAEAVAARVRTVLSELENRVAGVLRDYRSGSGAEKFNLISQDLVENEEPIDEIFLVDARGEISIPYTKPLYYLTGQEMPTRTVPVELERSRLWGQAEEAEFRAENYPQAIDDYQMMLAQASGQGVRAIILSRIGRCREKAGNYDQAVAAYKKALEIGPANLTLDAISMGLMAWHQIGNIYLKLNKKTRAAEAFLELYQGLLESRWPLTKNQFDFYRKSISDRIQALLSGPEAPGTEKDLGAKWSELLKLETALVSRMKTLEMIRQRIVPRLEARRNEIMKAPGRFIHLAESTEERLWLISSSRLDNHLALVLSIDPEALAQKALPSDPGWLRLREGWRLQVTDDAGKFIAGEGPSTSPAPVAQPGFSAGFEGNFPPWKIHILQSGPDAARRQYYLRRNVYMLTVAVVVSALFLGGFLAIRSTAKELRLAKLKADFVATVSHEFRTPLTSIRYLAELLQRGRVPQEERKQQYYDAITLESERLSRLVENVLDFSKIEAGMKEYRMEDTDIGALIADVAARFRQQASSKSIQLETEIRGQVPDFIVDREAISRALFNLLDNAVKYSGENPRLSLRARSEAENILLEVQDNGIGISRSEQKKIFGKFYRSDAVLDSNIKGSGIGLTLVDHIVRAHGGRVWLESELGQGTKVTLELPRRPPNFKKRSEHGSDSDH